MVNTVSQCLLMRVGFERDDTLGDNVIGGLVLRVVYRPINHVSVVFA